MTKIFFALAASAALALACGIGCNKSSEGGVAGSKSLSGGSALSYAALRTA